LIDRLEWLHVSDFHFVAYGDEFSQRVASESLLDDIRTRIVGHPPLSFVLVTGDIAFSGQREEYERASHFLSRLASIADVPSERFFFVAGNHDVDRTRHRLAFRGACHELTSQPAVDRVLGSADDLSPLIDRQAAFRAFVDGFTGDQERTQTADGLAYVASLIIGGLRVSILGLNSAWLSGRDAEEMKLVIGERQIINALELAQAANPHLQIAMAHHPVGWLQEWDQLSCHHRLLPAAHFYHRGHLHVAEVSLSSSPERPCLSIAAGSGHSTRFYANSYNLIELDLGEGACTVRPFRYDAAANKYAGAPSVTASVLLHGSLPGTREDLTAVLAARFPSAQPYAEYLGGLITGDKTEIPIKLGDVVEFRSPALADLIASDDLFEAVHFLKLRNLLRLYDENVPLAQRVAEHTAAIEGFADYLAKLAEQDSRCAERLTGRGPAAVVIASNSAASQLPHTAEFLADLRHRGDWPLLELQARRFVHSPDESVARFARAALAEALMHSDETGKRREAADLSAELTANSEASADDYLLAAGSSEVVGDNSAAIEFAKNALTHWPDRRDVRDYARKLALRTGDAVLRAAVEDVAGG
jgi:predicted MPP superfamily phosphohydrolase